MSTSTISKVYLRSDPSPDRNGGSPPSKTISLPAKTVSPPAKAVSLPLKIVSPSKAVPNESLKTKKLKATGPNSEGGKKNAVLNAGKGRSDDSNKKEKDSITEEYREGENEGIGNQVENSK